MKHKSFICAHLCILLAILSAVSGRIGFYPQKEYKYEYVGRVSSSLPNVADTHGAVIIKSTVIIQADGNNLLVQLDNVEAFNGEYQGDLKEVTKKGQLPFQHQPQPELRLPFRILFRGNTDEFNGIEASSEDPAWSVNIKKALASFLQVRLDQQISKRQGYFADSAPSGSYQPIDVVEVGVDGKCSTKYIYSRQPSPENPTAKTLNVTKFRDNKSCQDRAIWKRTISEPLQCSDCSAAKEDFIKHGSVSYYAFSESNGQYTLDFAKHKSLIQTSVFPPKGDFVSVVQTQKLNLKDVTRINNKINFPARGVLHSIMANTPDDEVEEVKPRYTRQATKTGAYTKTSPLKKQPVQKMDKKEKVRQILDEEVTRRNMEKEPDLTVVPRIVELLRKFTLDESQTLFLSVNDEVKQKLLVDFLVMAGTDASILAIKHLVEQSKIKGEHAANVISNIPAYVLEPTPAILEEIWVMCKDNLVKQSRQLYVSTLLAFGELVNQACVPKGQPKSVTPFRPSSTGCPSSLTSRYLQELSRLFDTSPHNWEKVSVAMTMMRMGLNNTIDYIAPLLQNKFHTYLPSVRTTLLMSLYESGPARQDDVVKYLMPILYNSSLGVEERFVSMDVIAYSTTSQQVINQIALCTWSECKGELHSYIYSYLQSVSTMTHTCWASLAQRCRQALPMAKPTKIGLFDSRYGSFNKYIPDWSVGSLLGYAFTFSPKAAFPTISFAHMANEINGHYYSSFESMLYADGLQKFVDYLMGPQSLYVHDFKMADLFKDVPLGKTKYQQDELNVKPRDYEHLSTFWMLSYLGTRHRLFFFDENTLTDLRQSGLIPSNKDLYSTIRDGLDINYQKYAMLEDSQIRFTSAIGVPLSINVKVPLYVDIRGKISAEMAKTGISNSLSSLSIKPELKSTFAYKLWFGVKVEAPFAKAAVGTFVTKSASSTLPLFGYLNFDFTQRSISAGLRQPPNKAPQRSPIRLFNVTTEPVIYVIDTETQEQVIHPIHTPHPYKLYTHDIPFMGGNVHIGTGSDKTNNKKILENVDEKHEAGTLHTWAFWWVPHVFTYDTVDFTYQPSNYDTNQMELKVDWKPTYSPYETELLKGTDGLLRWWNLIPENLDLPLPCDVMQETLPVKHSQVETTTQSSWFSRLKSKVKKTFGRSGGDDPDDDEDDTKSKEEDGDKSEEEDRGRALHPHLVHGSSGGDTAPGSRSSMTGTGGYSGQSRSSYDQYGQTSGGDDYGQSKSDAEDFSQQSSKGFGGGYAPGTGPGKTTYPYKPQTGDQTGPKSVVKVLNFKDEVTTGMIAVQLNVLGQTKGQANLDITVTSNKPQGTTQINANLDINNIYINKYKVCYTAYLNGLYNKCPGLLTQDGMQIHSRIQYGEVCDAKNVMNFKAHYTMSKEALMEFEKLKRDCNIRKQSYLPNHQCHKRYRDLLFDEETQDAVYTPHVPVWIHTLNTKYFDKNCELNKYLLFISPAAYSHTGSFTDQNRAIVKKEYKNDTLDLTITSQYHQKYWNGIDYTKVFGPHVFPLSPFYSYPYQLADKLTNGKFHYECDIFNGTVVKSRYNLNFDDGCEYVVAKDCSPSQLFTVSVAQQQKKLQKVTLHILNHKISIDPTRLGSGNVEFEVDDKKQSLSKGQVAVVRSQGYDDHFLATVSNLQTAVNIKSPHMGFQIIVTPVFFKIMLIRSWEGKICGLCESAKLEDYLYGPDQCPYGKASLPAYVSSYRVSSPKCPSKPSDSPCNQKNKGYYSPTLYGPATYSPFGSSGSIYSRPGGQGGYHEGTGDSYGSYGGGSNYEAPPPFPQRSGQEYGQLSQSSDLSSGTKGTYGGRFTQDKSQEAEEVVQAVTYQPTGSGKDENSCVVKRNFLKRMTETAKGVKVKKLCFSTTPHRQCRRTCSGFNMAPQTVKFICYKEPNTVAERWATEVNDRPLNDLVATDYDFEEELMVAQDCNPQY